MMQNGFKKIERMFVYQNSSNFQSEIQRCQISSNGIEANITNAMSKTYFLFTNIQIFHPQKSKYVNLISFITESAFIVPYTFIEIEYVMIRYSNPRNLPYIQENQNHSSSSLSSNDKKQRSHERTIFEVINLVKLWRNYHNNTPKLNLQESAKKVGVSKKTLDDYYYQLRIGELKGFNFKYNLNQKIGVLRNFIKGYRQDKVNKSYLSHPRKLKIIEDTQFQDFVMASQQKNINEKQKQMQLQQKGEQKYEQKPFSLDISQMMASQNSQDDLLQMYENQFFGHLDFSLDEPNDPFFRYEKSFKKKNYGQFDDFS